MSKVKIVQMTMACSADGDEHAEYLDDKGRVWYEGGRYERDPLTREPTKWIPEWHQVELPEEPEADL